MEKKGSDLEQCENIFKKIRTSDHWLTFKKLIKINVWAVLNLWFLSNIRILPI